VQRGALPACRRPLAGRGRSRPPGGGMRGAGGYS